RYTNVSLVRVPKTAVRGIQAWIGERIDRTRIAIVVAAIVINVFAILLLRADWYSLAGGVLWVVSLALLIVAYTGEPKSPSGETVSTGAATRQRFWNRKHMIEAAFLIAILGVALTLRLWRLGDLAPGMHGDEGEAGTQALNILNGNLVSPFMRGWFNQSNIYYWSLAICMKIFGSGLFGLRAFALISGMLTVIFVYLVSRELFGPRVAIIAGFFISFQSASLLFSRQEFSNVTVPPMQAATFYFLVRGLRTRRHLDFAIAGLISGFAIYYFAGGRLIAPIAVLFLVYLAVMRRPFLRAYWSRVLAYFIALVAIATPFAAYYLTYPIPSNAYPNDRFIWSHHADLSVLYGTSDWRTILWDQVTRTLGILTQGIDLSAMSALDFPIARPIEAVFIVLGLAWIAWRWRDSRFALLSIWFWVTIIVGGVLTTDAPNLPRIVGVLPVLAIAIALTLDHFWELITNAFRRIGDSVKMTRSGFLVGGALAATVIIVSGIQNKSIYIDSYLHERTNTIVTAQAAYVKQHGLANHYYEMGAPIIFWTHGDNRFINPHAQGEDLANVSDYLPIIDNGANANRNAIFMLWQPMYPYLSLLQTYYPEGRVHTIRVGDRSHVTSPLLTFGVPRSVIDKHRTLTLRYRSANGRAVTRRTGRLGLPAGASLPAGIRYPVQVSWTGGLVAPAYDLYHLRVTGPANAKLLLDGAPVHRTSRTTTGLIMAEGVHSVRLTARLRGPGTGVNVTWSSTTIPEGSIARRYVWDGHVGRSWLGDVHPIPGGISPLALGAPSRRVDGFLGFRSAGQAFGPASGVSAHWTSNLVVHYAGVYTFQVNSMGSSSLLVDGKPVIENNVVGTGPNLAGGQARLTRGNHRLELRYTWQGGIGYLEFSFQPPNSSRQLFISPDLHATGPGVWPAGSGKPPVPVAPIPVPAQANEPLGDQE
ncbi:MAG: glycosyltransferase family 39 protein, partial [Chloroflexota bacterium]